jgi:predicted CopG family antitoxin
MDNKKVRFNMWIQGTAYNELKALGLFEGRSVSDIVRVLINDYILKKKMEKKNLDS